MIKIVEFKFSFLRVIFSKDKVPSSFSSSLIVLFVQCRDHQLGLILVFLMVFVKVNFGICKGDFSVVASTMILFASLISSRDMMENHCISSLTTDYS